MEFHAFSSANRARCESPQGFNHKLKDWSTSDWLTATLGELGEAANVAKKLNRVRDGIPGNIETEIQLREMLAGELADTFIYLDLMCQSLGVDLELAVIKKFDAKSIQIGYPVALQRVHR
jgi:NTP pyrophosphatase (non-canonical NTP hydrolase)